MQFAVCGFNFDSTGRVPWISQCVRLMSRNTAFMRQGHFSLKLLRGCCVDGARFKHVRTFERCPSEAKSRVSRRCSNHASDLILQEAERELRLTADTLRFCCHQRHIQTQNFVPVSFWLRRSRVQRAGATPAVGLRRGTVEAPVLWSPGVARKREKHSSTLPTETSL